MSPVRYVYERHILYSSSPLGRAWPLRDLFLQLWDGRGWRERNPSGQCGAVTFVPGFRTHDGLYGPAFTPPITLPLPFSSAAIGGPYPFSVRFSIRYSTLDLTGSVQYLTLRIVSVFRQLHSPKPNKHQHEPWHFCHRLYVMFVCLAVAGLCRSLWGLQLCGI